MKGYTIKRTGTRGTPRFAVLNPSGFAIAHNCSYRSARKIADALNETREAERSGYMSGFDDVRG